MRRTKGHRSTYTRVRIKEILLLVRVASGYAPRLEQPSHLASTGLSNGS